MYDLELDFKSDAERYEPYYPVWKTTPTRQPSYKATPNHILAKRVDKRLAAAVYRLVCSSAKSPRSRTIKCIPPPDHDPSVRKKMAKKKSVDADGTTDEKQRAAEYFPESTATPTHTIPPYKATPNHILAKRVEKKVVHRLVGAANLSPRTPDPSARKKKKKANVNSPTDEKQKRRRPGDLSRSQRRPTVTAVAS